MTIPTKILGRSGLPVTVLGFGGTALGNMYAAMSEREAGATLDAAYASGIRYFDTAPLYGHGLSELRTGSGLRAFADPEVMRLDQGRLAAEAGVRPAGRRRPVRAHYRLLPVQRLQLRRRDALVRGQPQPSGSRSRRHPADPRRGPPQPGRALSRGVPRRDGRSLPGAARAARAEAGQGHRLRAQRMGVVPGLRGGGRLRLLPAGRPLHAPAPGVAGDLPAAVRAARHRHHPGRPVQLRHPGERCGARTRGSTTRRRPRRC